VRASTDTSQTPRPELNRTDRELLFVANCSHQAGAEQLVREVLDDAGLGDVAVRTTRIESEAQAIAMDFAGSPSFRINGADPFPVPPPPSLACRLYRNSVGLGGLPDRSALTDAVEHARGEHR